MDMKKAIMAMAVMLGLVLGGSSASAAGSDSSTPYTLDNGGITLPNGETFKAHGHVNIKYLDSAGAEKSTGVHFDPNNNQPGGKWIGRNFIPWSAFSGEKVCITWVQVHGYNEHFGEGGQEPVCLKKPGTPPPSDSEDRERITDVNCEERVVSWIKEKRDAIFDYDYKKAKWVQTGWKPWVEVDSGVRNEKHPSCEDLPEVGSPLGLLPLAVGLFMMIGGGIALLRNRKSR